MLLFPSLPKILESYTKGFMIKNWVFNFQYPGAQVLTRRRNSADRASWSEYWKGKILKSIILRFWDEFVLSNLIWILDSVMWYVQLILLGCIFRHVFRRVWLLCGSGVSSTLQHYRQLAPLSVLYSFTLILCSPKCSHTSGSSKTVERFTGILSRKIH